MKTDVSDVTRLLWSLAIACVVVVGITFVSTGSSTSPLQPPPQRLDPVYGELVQRDGDAAVYRMGPEARVRDLFRAAGEEVPGTIDGNRRLVSGERLVLEPSGGWSASWMPGERLVALGLQVRLNEAGLSDLKAVPGISERVALGILTRRNEIGRFHSISQLEDIPGIGPQTMKTLAQFTQP